MTLACLRNWRESGHINITENLYEDSRNWTSLSADSPSRLNSATADVLIDDLCFDKCGERLFAGTAEGTIEVFLPSRNSSSFYSIQTPHDDSITSVKLLGSNKLVTCSQDDGTIALIDNLTDFQVLHRFDDAINQLDCSEIEPFVFYSAGGDGSLYMYDIRSGDSSRQIELCSFYGQEILNTVSVAQYRPELIAIGGHQPFLWLLDRRRLPSIAPAVAQFMPVELTSDYPSVFSNVGIDPYGSMLCGSLQDGDSFLFETSAGVTEYTSSVDFIESSPVSVSSMRSETTAVYTTEIGRFKSCGSLKTNCFLGPLGKHLAISTDEGSYEIWSLPKKEKIFTSKRADIDSIRCLVSHPKQFSLVTAGSDSGFKIWTSYRKIIE